MKTIEELEAARRAASVVEQNSGIVWQELALAAKKALQPGVVLASLNAG